MDPLSITASILAIVGAAQQATKGVGKLRSLRNAKGDFSALLNELADLQTILAQATALSHDLDARGSDGAVIGLKSLLKGALAQVLELDQMIQYNLSKPELDDTGRNKLDRKGWILNESKVLALQRKLLTTRSNIATAIGLVGT
jgi:hypothetical protein